VGSYREEVRDSSFPNRIRALLEMRNAVARVSFPGLNEERAIRAPEPRIGTLPIRVMPLAY
jgi:hypothetical protein